MYGFTWNGTRALVSKLLMKIRSDRVEERLGGERISEGRGGLNEPIRDLVIVVVHQS